MNANRKLSTDKNWERIARLDPYFGVLSRDDYRADRISPETLEQFWTSGSNHIEAVLADLADALGSVPPAGNALDFGCGVGRLLPALASRFEHVYGVDVSTTMLAEAAANCERLHLENVQLLTSTDSLPNLPADITFVHSTLVFQHIPPKRGLALLRSLASQLSPGGAGYVQINISTPGNRVRRTARRITRHSTPLRRLQGLVLHHSASPSASLMVMYDYDLADVLFTLADAGIPTATVKARRYSHPYASGGRSVGLLFMKPLPIA